MKKTTFTIHAWNSFYLLLLLPLFIQSCIPLMEGSIDGNKQRFTGSSYSNSSSDNSAIAWNITLGVLLGRGAPEHRVDLRHSGNSYESNFHAPLAFYNNTRNGDEETAKPYEDKLSSGFISHLRYMANIEFIQKRSKDGITKITLNYLEVPVYALYQTEVSSTGSLFGGVGPYFAYGIGGNAKTSFNGQTSKTKAFDKTVGYKPFDAGLSLTAGYKMINSFSFRVVYDMGLANIERDAFDKTKNRTISLQVGYPLNKLIKK